jgi:signal transduction histidine kinase/CheY-like chemotaxis protein
VDYNEVVSRYFAEKGVRALAGVPLSVEDRVIGVLHVGRVEPGTFREEEGRFLQLAAQRIAVAIDRAAGRDVERKAREAAEAANRTKDEFLAMLGHELRNPLSAIRNAVVAARFDESRRDRALDIALRQTEQLTRLVDDLLDVARITQGRIRLRKERLSFGSVIERAVEGTRSFIEDRGHALSVSLAAEGMQLEGDPGRLEQVVTNLLTNAAKYTAPGGRVEVVAERQDEEAVLSVRDTGIGIKAEMLPRVFDLFAQSERTLDRAEGGLGIGLTIVRQLVELHGGRVEARSEGPGQGAEFVVRIPAPPLPEEQEETPAAPRSRVRARVLVVEDNPDAAEALGMLLDVLGHRVRVVHDGPAALRAARMDSPDIVLVDIGLPGINGYEVARRMREQPGTEKTVLVALTGYGREEDKQRALAAGFDHHLTKPVEVDALEELVAQVGKTALATHSALSRPAPVWKT